MSYGQADVDKLKDIYDQMRRAGVVSDPLKPHQWFGPACLHGRHALCDVTCPYCTAPCQCACHRAGLAQ